ncbi:hypothetical protein GC167_00725 [bacterium]|nr:hypothetical protein [bacterium]
MRVVYGVLNWGLGHATRSEPVIRALILDGHQVVLWSDGAALDYLRSVFPDLEAIDFPMPAVDYRVRPLWWGVALQAPGLWRQMREERQAFRQYCQIHRPDAVVSDNRPGLGYSGVPSVYLTHQMRIPLRGFPGWLANALHHWAMRGFTRVGIPDAAASPENTAHSMGTLSGKLSRFAARSNGSSIGLGHLSRFAQGSPSAVAQNRGPVVLLLSGPEPARTAWEAKLVEDIQRFTSERFVLVRGIEPVLELPEHIECRGRVKAGELGPLLAGAKAVICRSGYSTLLDLLWLGTPMHLVPTPGQAEQEYLARYLNQQWGIPFSIESEFEAVAVVQGALWKALPTNMAVAPDFEVLFGALEGKRKR